MTEPIEPGGNDAAPESVAAPIVAQRAITAPATVDRAARTVEVVWSTGARARNFVPTLGLITEELDMSPNAVRMEALRSGRAPVLDTHRRGGARDVLGPGAMQRLFAHPSATLRPLDDDERRAIASLALRPRPTSNAWIGIQADIAAAERSEIEARISRHIDAELGETAVEGMTVEQWAKVRRRAAWLAQTFIQQRQKAKTLRCDECGFDPVARINGAAIKPRSLLDVHHLHPLEEGHRVTTLADFKLLCPTCHRLEHALLRAGKAT